MARPKTKGELLEVSQREFDKLMEQIELLPTVLIEKPGACERWSIKDILAHLHGWHLMYLTWYEIGMAGEKPEMPAPGYTWKTTPELNENIYRQYEDMPLDAIVEKLNETHIQVIAIIHRHSDEELFTKKRFGWTGSTSLGSYTVSATSSHYDWANKLIKKFLKNSQSI